MEHAITLRPVTKSDLPIFYEQQCDPIAAEMASFPSRDHEPFMAHWEKIMSDESCIQRALLWDGQVAGYIGSWVQDGEQEVGYWLGREYWGHGIATEALRQLLREIPTRPLYAHVVKHNIASRRVLEKCGFKMLEPEDAHGAADEHVYVLQGGSVL